jgi:hypothetical protein
MANESPNSVTRIQELNDAFRRSFLGALWSSPPDLNLYPSSGVV